MPKSGAYSGAKKCFRATGSDELMYEQANKRHLPEHKSSRHAYHLAMDQPVDAANLKFVKRLLGH